MAKKISFIGMLVFVCLTMKAQTFMKVEDKSFNFGGKIGFNATFPIIHSLTVDGNEVEDMHLQYKVGYLAALFCRVNIDRFFIQPSFAWHRADGEVYYNLPSATNNDNENPTYSSSSNRLEVKTRSLEMPIMIGYHLVKQGPYGLSLMIGPKLKYNYKLSYTSSITDDHQRFENDNAPFGINIATGVGVSIWRLFFDFVYEFGINSVESDFTYIPSQAPALSHDIHIDKRFNTMSFSLGFLF